jgi:hypothetical protein
MGIEARTLYQSSNGDRWRLARDTDTGHVFVQHQANLASGGRISDIEVGTFLGAGGRGPEHQELLRLIGTLVEEADPAR